MNTAFRQETRAGRLELESGIALALVSFRGAEHLNALFEYELDCVSADGAVDFDALLGTHASVILKSYDASETPFDGIVTEARWLGPGADGHVFRLQLRPWFWLASRRRNQRIFHNKTAPQILSELLSSYLDAGRMVDRLRGDYPQLEYTVQHRETDLAFACRLMERHGISYHFEHAPLSHDMVLTDRAEDHADIGPRPFHPHEGHHRGEPEEHFWDWQPARRVTTGAVKLTDYNFKTPNAAMLSEAMGDAEYSQGQIESFDWPGDHPDPARGKLVASLRMQAERGQDRRFSAEGDVIGLRAGARVTLSGDKVPGTGGAYLCLTAVHSYAANRYGSGGGDDGAAHRAQFTLLPAEAPMVPELKTPLSLAPGPQTARVVGEGEIDCDDYGRILVQFPWDLDGAWSMRCRVSQNWGGNGWGGMVIPRIGMEVIVEFLDGDPDKPIVTGCVYNGKNDTPYPLPEH
ncbi:type VI secretion system tip protein VgrG, partial [Loktanella sp. IMCC34160]|uniref:type VI secretion system Vgr family protein n=1 Tax=Loktanella sp. IMCC34160 TaxID=2510646 RepID=UPI00101DEC45